MRSEVDGEKALLKEDELLHWQGLVADFCVDEALYVVSHEIACLFERQEMHLVELCSEESAIGEKMIWEKISHYVEKSYHSVKLR